MGMGLEAPQDPGRVYAIISLMPLPALLSQQEVTTTEQFDRSEILIRAVSEIPLASVWWIVAGVVIGLVAWFFFGRVQQRLWWLLLVPIAGVGAVMAVGGAVAMASGSERTVGDVVGLEPYDVAEASVLRAPVGRWPRGAVVDVTIPGALSGVGEMPGKVYLPPQYFTGDGPFPVVFLVGPAPTEDTREAIEPVAEVFDEGDAASAALASARSGRPVVLVVPAVSPPGEQTQCVNGALGLWETFLSVDVVSWAARQRQFDVQDQLSALGGVEMGGYCAQITGLRNHEQYGWTGNISGTTTLDNPGGNEEILGTGRGIRDELTWDSQFLIENLDETHTVSLWMAHSRDDRALVVRTQQDTAEAAEAADMAVELREFSGAPDWQGWRPQLGDWVNWAADRIYEERSSSSSSQSS